MFLYPQMCLVGRVLVNFQIHEALGILVLLHLMQMNTSSILWKALFFPSCLHYY